MQELLTALQETEIAEALRFWRWAYPIVNAGHILGIALLFGAIFPLDLRLLGLWRSIPVKLLARVLVPVAGAGLGLALVTGTLLFSVDPLKYADLALFRVKLLLIAAGAINVLVVHRSKAWKDVMGNASTASARQSLVPPLRLAGLVSASLWLFTILCGRFIAYV